MFISIRPTEPKVVFRNESKKQVKDARSSSAHPSEGQWAKGLQKPLCVEGFANGFAADAFANGYAKHCEVKKTWHARWEMVTLKAA